MSRDLITIGIPTFNRAREVCALVDQIERTGFLHGRCRVLVIDDASHDGTQERFAQPCWPILGDRLRYIRNHTNVGYPRNFMRLFAECETEYLLVMADDDLLVENGCTEALRFLDARHPALLSPQWLQGGALFRGTTRTRPIQLSEFLACSGHAPGLIYRVERCLAHLSLIESRLSEGCAFTATYPQVTLCLQLLLHGESSWFLSAPVAREGGALPSGIRDASGEHYATYRSRLRQAAALDQIISAVAPEHAREQLTSVGQLFYLQRIFSTATVNTQRAFLKEGAIDTRMKRILLRMAGAIKKPLKAARNAVMRF